MQRLKLLVKKINKREMIIAAFTAIIFCIFLILLFNIRNVPKPNYSDQTKMERNQTFPVKFKSLDLKINGRHQKINIIEADLKNKNVEVRPILSQDQVCGYELTSQMLSTNGAYAGVNGSLFDIYGQPLGLVVIRREIIASGEGYPVFGIDASGNPFLDKIRMSVSLQTPEKKYVIIGINKFPENDDTVILSDKFGINTRISQKAFNAVIENGVITKVFTSTEPAEIPKNSHVLVATGKNAKLFKTLKVGDRAALNFEFDPGITINNAIECGCWLVRNSKIAVPKTDPWIGRTDTREPRTAIGLKPDKVLVLLTVDGRQPGKSIGFTGKELAQYMLKLGVRDAALLDGGGSTTMWVKGKVVNTPSFQARERQVGNAVGIFVK